MGTYLENYLESVNSLPQEVRRNFALLRELDSRSQELIEKVEKNTKLYLKNYKKLKPEERESVAEEETNVRGDLKQCLELGDEKVALAVQTYELVDKHIRRLDMDLKKFEAELEQGGTTIHKEKSNINNNTTPVAVEKKPVEGKAQRKRTAAQAVVGDGVAAVPPNARIYSVDIDMPIDPNEPTYCICNRVSFGEMVGCDNADCKIEWFHFECVGLTGPPKGKWHCPDCTALKKKQRL